MWDESALLELALEKESMANESKETIKPISPPKNGSAFEKHFHDAELTNQPPTKRQRIEEDFENVNSPNSLTESDSQKTEKDENLQEKATSLLSQANQHQNGRNPKENGLQDNDSIPVDDLEDLKNFKNDYSRSSDNKNSIINGKQDMTNEISSSSKRTHSVWPANELVNSKSNDSEFEQKREKQLKEMKQQIVENQSKPHSIIISSSTTSTTTASNSRQNETHSIQPEMTALFFEKVAPSSDFVAHYATDQDYQHGNMKEIVLNTFEPRKWLKHFQFASANVNRTALRQFRVQIINQTMNIFRANEQTWRLVILCMCERVFLFTVSSTNKKM
jgi:hypothetical protein